MFAKAARIDASDPDSERAERLSRTLLRLARVAPVHARLARAVAHALLPHVDPRKAEWTDPAPASRPRPDASDRALVRRILRDLG